MSTPKHNAYDCIENAVNESDAYIQTDEITLEKQGKTTIFTCKVTGEELFRMPGISTMFEACSVIDLVNEAFRAGIREGYSQARDHLETLRQ